jgi:predicted aldo/keto reductase-like oxidoreductase
MDGQIVIPEKDPLLGVGISSEAVLGLTRVSLQCRDRYVHVLYIPFFVCISSGKTVEWNIKVGGADHMSKVTLGTTGITVDKNGFGALPVQRVDMQSACVLLRKAYDGGINFFDTARFYSDSEWKIAAALGDVRNYIYIATKTFCSKPEEFREQLRISLDTLRTDYVDIYQFHNPPFCPKPGDGSGLYEEMQEAKAKGLIRHIGLSNHRIKVAFEAVESGLYETIQYPFNYLATPEEVRLVHLCKERGVGFIAMKAMSGGLITDSAAAYAYLAQFDHVLPIWGIQKTEELDEFLSYIDHPPVLDEKIKEVIERDRKDLSGDFCRGCGYCMPCPANIEVYLAARMGHLMQRAPISTYLTEEWKEKMRRADDCTHCNHCRDHCPYGLDTPALVAKNSAEYKKYL